MSKRTNKRLAAELLAPELLEEVFSPFIEYMNAHPDEAAIIYEQVKSKATIPQRAEKLKQLLHSNSVSLKEAQDAIRDDPEAQLYLQAIEKSALMAGEKLKNAADAQAKAAKKARVQRASNFGRNVEMEMKRNSNISTTGAIKKVQHLNGIAESTAWVYWRIYKDTKNHSDKT